MATPSLAFQAIESPIRWLFLVHTALGALALAILIIPLVSKKGGKLHVRTGWIYTLAMIVVGASALVITPWRAFFDSARTDSSRSFALFLFFIAIMTLSSISHGLQALRHKKRTAPLKGVAQLGLPALLALSALVVEAVGIMTGQALLILFPVLGLFIAYGQAEYWWHAPEGRMHWWYAHMLGMGNASIATITAFLVTALPKLFEHAWFHSLILWIAPGVIMGNGLGRWVESYRARFEAAPAAGRPTSP